MRLPSCFTAVVLVLSQAAHAEESPTSTPGTTQYAETTLSHLEQHERAVHLYQTGEAEKAALILATLINDVTLTDTHTRQQAQVYLGEVHYSQENKEEARRLFEVVLTTDPDFVMDPFAHPPDVVGFFETIRAYIRPPPPPMLSPQPIGPIPRTPVSAYLGFGIYQVRHGDKRLGTALAIGQSIFAIVSLASFAGLLEDRSWESKDERTRLQTQQAVQWSSTAGFYGMWIWSAVDAKRHWRANANGAIADAPGIGKSVAGPQYQLSMSTPTR
jgi:hypothetical protein